MAQTFSFTHQRSHLLTHFMVVVGISYLLILTQVSTVQALPSNNELKSIGLFSVTSYGADNTGTTDSTNAIQSAIDDAYRKDAAVFFPPGNYKISRTLIALKDRAGQVGSAYHFIGSTSGSQLPTLTLAPNSFNDNNVSNDSIFENGKKKAVLHMWACDFVTKSETGKTNCDPDYNDQLNDVNQTNGNTAMLIGNSIQNLRIVIGSNNPDAIGLRITGNQENALSNVIVEAGNGFAGIYGSMGINTVNQDITVIGGKYGIYNGYGGWATYTNVTLKDQQILAFTSPNVLPVSLNGFEIVKDSAPAVGQVSGVNYASANGLHPGAFTLHDGVINFRNDNNSAAISTPNGKQIALANVYVNNASKLIQTEDQTYSGNGSGWSRIIEFANTMPSVGHKLIEGVSSQTDFVSSNSFQTQSIPSPNATALKLSHGVSKNRIPSPDVLLDLSKQSGSGVINVADHGITPVPLSTRSDDPTVPDFSTTLNQLFSNPSNKYILLPKGVYPIKNTLILGKDTHVIGIAPPFTKIKTHINWKPGQRVDMVRTVNDKEATTTLSGLEITSNAAKGNNFFDTIHWQAGKNSIIYFAYTDNFGADGSPKCDDSSDPVEVARRYGDPRNDYHFSHNAGGRVWGNSTGGAGCSKYHAQYRGVLIESTTQPLTIYGYNPEDGHGDTMNKREGYQGEIRNSKNVAIIGHKSEESYSLLVKNSSNILLLNPSGSVGWALRDNANILVLNTVAKFERYNNKIKDMIEEEINGSITQQYRTNQAVSAIKRGNVDFSVWDLDNIPPDSESPTPTENPNNPTPTQSDEPTASPTISDRNVDYNNDNKFDWLDLLIFLPRFALENRPKYDLNTNGFVDIFDFTTSIIWFN